MCLNHFYKEVGLCGPDLRSWLKSYFWLILTTHVDLWLSVAYRFYREKAKEQSEEEAEEAEEE